MSARISEWKIGDRIRLSGGKVLTYAGISPYGSFYGHEKWVDKKAADGEGIPMYVAAGHVNKMIKSGHYKRLPHRTKKGRR